MSLGERIKSRRLELGLTLEDVAKHLNVNRSTVKRYEDGKTQRIAQTTIEKLAVILNTTTGALLGLDSQKKEEFDGEILTLARNMKGLDSDDLDLLKVMIGKMAEKAKTAAKAKEDNLHKESLK